jgi:hypothetical protein
MTISSIDVWTADHRVDGRLRHEGYLLWSPRYVLATASVAVAKR